MRTTTMNFRYDPESDMLYIELIQAVSTESEEVAPGFVIDFDNHNRVIGIEIEEASKSIDLSRLEVSALPVVSLILDKSTLPTT